MKDNISFDSLCVKANRANITTQPHQLPIFATSSFVFDGLEEVMKIFTGELPGHLYSRYGNPTLDSVAQKLAQLELYGTGMEGRAYLTSSGMAAIATLSLGLLQSGDTILTQGNLYGGTTVLFRKVLQPLGIQLSFINMEDIEAVRAALKSNPSIKMLYLETPANPTLACINIQKISELAHEYSCQVAVDNTFATPYLQQPLKLGADFVVHSTTKYLNGHGNSIAGVIVGKDTSAMEEKVFPKLKLLGTNGNPWDAWLLNNGLKTLAIRMDRHCSNALYLAEWLQARPEIKIVNYPGLMKHPAHDIAQQQMKAFGGMLSFELEGGLEAGKRFVDQLQLCTIAPTLGDVDTLVLHPASTSHLNIPREERIAQGISDGLIRISVGIENQEDIKKDLERGLMV